MGSTLSFLTLTYDGNTHTGGAAPATASYTSGATATVQSAGTLVKTGFTFAGWNTAAGGTGTPYAAGETFTITGNTTLYAQWTTSTPGTTYTVTYDPNGGTGTVPTDTTAYTSGSTVTVLASPSPTRSGYTFGGWSLSSGGAAVTRFIMPTSSATLYAQWTPAILGKLATPVVNWGNGNDKGKLSWSAIGNASGGYKVATYTSTSTTYIPTGATTQSSLTFTPSPPAVGNTTCVSITATNSSNAYADSDASTAKCVTAVQGSGNSGVTYTYQ